MKPSKEKSIVLNSAKCLGCKETLISKHRHDFVTCKCGCLSVDGGLDYLKRSYSPRGQGYKDLSKYGKLREEPQY